MKTEKKIIGLTYDVKDDWTPRPGDPVDINAEFDRPQTIEHISQALESNGYTVKRIGNAHRLLSHIDDLGVDIVFNIAEGYSGRNRESQIPVILEMKGIPFVGSDGLTLGLTLDKVMAKKCFIAEGIPTPRYFQVKNSENLKELNTIGFPLIVKACYEGTSKGLTKKSKVDNYDALKEQVDFITKTYKQPAIVEEFIRGTEFTVAVLGNENPEAMPVVQTKIEGKLDVGDLIYTYEHIVKDTVEYMCPAPISKDLEMKLRDIAVRAYKCVDCRDFGRVDFRVDEKNNPYVLEINPLPSLARNDVFCLIPQTLGITYEDMISRILNYGLERYGLSNGKVQMKPKLMEPRRFIGTT